MESRAFLRLLVRQIVGLQLPQRGRACAHVLHCRVTLNPFHLNKMRSDFVDAFPDSSPGRRVDELPSGAVLRASRPAALHVQGVRVEGAAERADVPQVPQEGNAPRQSDIQVEARERAMQLRRDLHIFVQNSQAPAPTC